VHGVAPSTRVRGARPELSYQRAVSWQRLSEGLTIDLADLVAPGAPVPTIIAWIEPGQPNLPYDAALAIPPSYASRSTPSPRDASRNPLTFELTLCAPSEPRKSAA